MKKEEEKKVCEAAQFALNVFWKGKAHVDIINSQLFWFSITYGYDFDAMNELKQLGILYNSAPKNWVRGEHVQDFFMTADIWEKIRKRYQSLKK